MMPDAVAQVPHPGKSIPHGNRGTGRGVDERGSEVWPEEHLAPGDELEVLPGDTRARVRSAQIHGQPVERAIKRGAGAGEGDAYVEMRYEGYGPGGVAVIVEALTDNRQRTAPEIRHYFDKYGGNMGATGCVSWSFDKKGVIVINDEDQELDEDKVMEDALEAGAADFAPDEGVYTVYTDPDDVASVAEALTNDGYELLSAQVEMVPQNTIKLTDEGDIKNLQKMLDMFEDNEDVQNVWHNWQQD